MTILRRCSLVQVILDKSHAPDLSRLADFSTSKIQGTIMIDAEHTIAHRKIIIIDRETIITGSFNFTKAAQEKNAENLLIIRDQTLPAQYTQNWETHRQHSAAVCRAEGWSGEEILLGNLEHASPCPDRHGGVCPCARDLVGHAHARTHRCRRRRSRSGPGDALRAQVLGVVRRVPPSRWTSRADMSAYGYLGIEPLGPPAGLRSTGIWSRANTSGSSWTCRSGISDGRLLAYVYVGDLMVNAELVRQGYAHVNPVPPGGKYARLFQQLQQRGAGGRQRGVWGAK